MSSHRARLVNDPHRPRGRAAVCTGPCTQFDCQAAADRMMLQRDQAAIGRRKASCTRALWEIATQGKERHDQWASSRHL
eukprot:1506220-Pleurochrysis_carterae.AAC.4